MSDDDVSDPEHAALESNDPKIRPENGTGKIIEVHKEHDRFREIAIQLDHAECGFSSNHERRGIPNRQSANWIEHWTDLQSAISVGSRQSCYRGAYASCSLHL